MFYPYPPENFDPVVEGACCYYRCGERFLFLQNNAHEAHPGLWATPGGKMEAGELPAKAVIREMFEETGLTLSEGELVFMLHSYVRDPDFGDYRIHAYFVKGPEHLPEITVDISEHEGYVWATLHEALGLELIPAQRQAVEYLLNEERFHDLLSR